MPVIADLSLTITPTHALYTQNVPDGQITVNESTVEGRNAIILDFNNTEGLYTRDLGTIFQWPTIAGTILDIWQPTVIPMDGELYQRLSYHCLMTSLAGSGWQHARDMDIAFASTTDLNLLLTFDQWPNINLTIPSSGGATLKTTVELPANKWKMMEIFLSSAQPFLLWTNDLEMKVRSWGSTGPYRVERPVSG